MRLAGRSLHHHHVLVCLFRRTGEGETACGVVGWLSVEGCGGGGKTSSRLPGNVEPRKMCVRVVGGEGTDGGVDV